MSSSNGNTRHRVGRRSQRTLRSVLLALGIMGLLLGFFLVAWSMLGNPKLKTIGIIYVLISLIFLGAHAILVEIRKASQRKKL